MKNREILQKVADLVGFKFSSFQTFAEVELEGGLVITNQTEGDWQVGDLVSLKNDDGTFTIVGAGEHKLLDGRVFITDMEGKLTEIRDVVSETEVVEVEAAEVEVEVPEMVEDVMTPEVVEAVVEALAPIVEELKVISEEMKKLKRDYEGFKASSAYTPLKEDKLISNAFNTDHRYDVLKQLKEKYNK
jgi:hypothetical protein